MLEGKNDLVLNEKYCFIQHEDASVKLLDHLVEVNNLSSQFQEYGLDWEEKKVFIKELMTGKHDQV